MRKYISADLEWPAEVPKPTIKISNIKRVLTELKVDFSDRGIREVLKALWAYPVDAYNENNNPKKDERRKALHELKKLSSSTMKFITKLRNFTTTDPNPYISEVYSAFVPLQGLLVELQEKLDLHLKFLIVKGQGKGGGAPKEVPTMLLAQRLVVIFKRETGDTFSAVPGAEVDWARTGWGRERAEYNRRAIQYLSKLILLIDPSQEKDVKRIIRLVKQKPYRPDIDLE